MPQLHFLLAAKQGYGRGMLSQAGTECLFGLPDYFEFPRYDRQKTEETQRIQDVVE
jgi:hypothetical protein